MMSGWPKRGVGGAAGSKGTSGTKLCGLGGEGEGNAIQVLDFQRWVGWSDRVNVSARAENGALNLLPLRFLPSFSTNIFQRTFLNVW